MTPSLIYRKEYKARQQMQELPQEALRISGAFEKYNKAFDERREKIRTFKSGLTVNSSTKDIDRYNQMCFDACQDLQDYLKELKLMGSGVTDFGYTKQKRK